MSDRDPKPTNPLAPYYPSEPPTIPGNGRQWFAILMALVLIFGTAYSVLVIIL